MTQKKNESNMNQEAINHLNIILENSPRDGGFIELRTFSDKGSGAAHQFFLPTSATPAHIEEAVSWCEAESRKGRGVFVGYNARDERDGSKSAVTRYSAAYVDLDLDKKGISREEAIRAINESPIRPDIILNSGGGLHVIHFFEPTTDFAHWTALQRKLAEQYKDVGADNSVVTDSARVLRLAPFANQKQDAPRKTEIIEWNRKEAAPSFAVIADIFEAKPSGLVASSTASGIPEEIAEGGGAEYEGRNQLLHREASKLRAHGFTATEILPLIEKVNELRCHPPLPYEDVVGLVNRAAKYEPREQIVVVDDEEADKLDMSIAEFRRLLFPSITPIIYGLHAGELGMVQARPNIGKTTLMLNLAYSMATGREFAPLVEAGEPKRVMVLDFENRANFLQQDIEKMARNFDEEEQTMIGENLRVIVDKELGGVPLNLSNETHFDVVLHRAKKFMPSVIIIDTMAAGFTLSNENDNSEVKRVVIDPLTRLAKTTGACILLVHHIGKQGENQDGSKLYRARGASALAAAVRLVLDIDSLKDADKKAVNGFVTLNCAKIKGKPFEDVTYRLNFEARWFEVSDHVAPESKSVQEQIWSLVDRPMKLSEVMDAAMVAGNNASKSTIIRALNLAVSAGIITKDAKAVYTPSSEHLVSLGMPPVEMPETEAVAVAETEPEQSAPAPRLEVVPPAVEVPAAKPERKSRLINFPATAKIEIADADGNFREVAAR